MKTEAELLEDLNRGVCPDCRAREFEHGPRGGFSQNIKCMSCGARFNVAPRGPGYTATPLLFAERI